MTNQGSIFSPNLTNRIEMFVNENAYMNLSTQNLNNHDLLKEAKGLKKTQRNGSIRLQRQS